jgi:hypothetical protein
VLFLAAPAAADIPPGPIVDPCTVDSVESTTPARGCVLCEAPFADRDFCARLHGATRRWQCNGHGHGDVRPEVWCDDGLLAAERREWEASSDFERGERIGNVIGTVCGCGCCTLVPIALAAAVYAASRPRKSPPSR